VDKFLTKMYHTCSDFVFYGHARVRAQLPDARIDRMISRRIGTSPPTGRQAPVLPLAAESVGESTSTTDDQPRRKRTDNGEETS